MDTTHQKLFEQATHLLIPLGFEVIEFWKGTPELVISLPTVEEAIALIPQVADILNEAGLWAEVVKYGNMVEVYINDECRPGEAQQILHN